MFLGEISKVKVKKPLLHANYCWALTSLCQDNNLNISDPPNHQWDYGGELQQLQVHLGLP